MALPSLAAGILTVASATAQEKLLKQPQPAPAERAAAEREFQIARRAVANGDTKTALALYERILKRDPRNDRALAEMVDAASSHVLIAAAPTAREYRQIAEQARQEPTNPEENLRLARAAAKQGDIKQALQAYERVLALDPHNREARNGMIGTLVSAAVPSAGPKDEEIGKLFDEIMRDPTNVELNLRYARLAIERGEPRKALPAYERVLARDPNNAEAKEGLERVRVALEPTITQVTAAFGAFYESNPRHFRRQSKDTQAGTLAGRVSLYDERRIGDIAWRTEGEAFFTWHTNFHEIDYGVLGLRGGPVFNVGDHLRVNPFIGAGYAWLKGRTLYGEVTAGGVVEFKDVQPIHSISARFGYNSIGQHISTRDAVFVEVSPRFLFANLGYKGAAGWLNPYWRYNGVLGSGAPGLDQRTEPYPARAHQIGVRADYFMPITSELTIGVNAAYEYRHFYEPVSEGGKNRRDHLVSPGIQAIVTGLIDDRFGIIISYGFEHRFSNDGPQIFSNHSAGVRFLWRN